MENNLAIMDSSFVLLHQHYYILLDKLNLADSFKNNILFMILFLKNWFGR